MRYGIFPIAVEGSNPSRHLRTYILDDTPANDASIHRPIVMICPGGGYTHVSEREGECIAMRYLAMGYHAAVLHYSVAPARFPTALLELGAAMKLIHENAADWHVDTANIFVQGFSAGGHLSACLGVFWNHPKLGLAQKLGTLAETLRPKGLLLAYPVISTAEMAIHKVSLQDFLGHNSSYDIDDLSVELHVSKDTPPAFIWHTANDAVVPVQNALVFASALAQHHVPFELHVYPYGTHGLSLANEISAGGNPQMIEPICQNWINLAETWIKEQVNRACY